MIKRGLSFEEMVVSTRDDKEFRVAKEFVENLFFDMAKMSTKYCNKLFCDLPYTYRERALESIMLPVLSKMCNNLVLVEIPVTRKCDNRRFYVEKSSGRIDFWCIYNNYTIIIELKHSFDCFTTPNTRERVVTNRWLKVNEQLESIKDDVKEFVEETKGIIRIGLHVITSYSDKPQNRKKLISQFTAKIPDTFKRFARDLSKPYSSLKPDLMICWKIPPRIVMDERQDGTFAGLWCIAKIYSTLRHQGAVK